jgi:hypothetical protein
VALAEAPGSEAFVLLKTGGTMTEAEWLACTDPEAMLEFLRGRSSERKLRLFAAACCRRIWHLLDEEEYRAALEVAERFVEGQASLSDLSAAYDEVYEMHEVVADSDVVETYVAEAVVDACSPEFEPFHATNVIADVSDAVATAASTDTQAKRARTAERRAQAHLVRDLFGNLCRPVPIDRAWRTAGIRALARAAYEERTLPAGTLDGARLAVLGDALEEAGAAGTLLDHLRGPGVHVRGCWVLDLVLARE